MVLNYIKLHLICQELLSQIFLYFKWKTSYSYYRKHAPK